MTLLNLSLKAMFFIIIALSLVGCITVNHKRINYNSCKETRKAYDTCVDNLKDTMLDSLSTHRVCLYHFNGTIERQDNDT